MRTKNGAATRQRRNKILKRAKGFHGARSTLFRQAKEATMRADRFALVGRRKKKREYRAIWITRLSAACELNGMLYSRLIAGCNKAGVRLNRKELSELAIHDPAAFSQVCETAKAALH